MAALDHLEAFHPAIEAVKSERARLTAALRQRGFAVADSEANFVFARSPGGDGEGLYRALKERGILVRHFPEPPELADGLRITVGSHDQNDALLEALDALGSV